jgi:tight adherence protein B
MMIIFAVVCVGMAVAMAVRPSTGPVLQRRLGAVVEEQPLPRGRDRRRRLMVTAALTVVPVLGLLLDGGRGLCCGVAVMIIGGTVVVLGARGARRRLAARRRRAVAHACGVLAGQVRIGQVPLVAVRSAAEDCPVLAGAVATAELGGDVIGHWQRQATEPGQQGLADLARAWQLADATGAGMAEVLDQVTEALHEDEALALMIASEVAGPRSSGKIMALLPVVGIGLGYLIGGDPITFLFDSPAGWGCLVGGAASACSGVLWMEWVADRAGTEV